MDLICPERTYYLVPVLSSRVPAREGCHPHTNLSLFTHKPILTHQGTKKKSNQLKNTNVTKELHYI